MADVEVTDTTVTSGGMSPVWGLLLGDGQGSAQVSMSLTLGGGVTGVVGASVTDVVSRNAYEPFGSVRGSDNLEVSRGWLGQVSDADTGLVYLNARYYDPVLARFISPDPLMNPGDPKTLDPYRYADNNPVMMSDPSGLEPHCDKYRSGADDCVASYKYQKGTKDYKARIDRLRTDKKFEMPSQGRCSNSGPCAYANFANRFLDNGGGGLTPAGLDRVDRNATRCSQDSFACINPHDLAESKRNSDMVGATGGVLLAFVALVAGCGAAPEVCLLVFGGESAAFGRLATTSEGAAVNAARFSGMRVVSQDALPALEASYASSFGRGAYTVVEVQPGTVLYRAEALSATRPGQYFGIEAVSTAAEAEVAYYLAAWGNPMQVQRTYVTTQPFLAYAGSVHGGEGYQILVPSSVSADSVVRMVGMRVLP